ncbi:MAG: ABC transporter substrate-binding protein [Candidatus Brocadiales bacterium]|nr:ABC transporter substrate-binding protein [Candidatus Bathyanammoxibius amoris]
MNPFRSIKGKLFLLTLCVSLIPIAITTTTMAWAGSNPQVSTPDLSKHPTYAAYDFERGEGVINIGTQSVYMPTGLISETMKRDIILKTSLLEMGMKIRFYDFLKGDDVNFFLRRGDIDAGIVGDMPALTIAATLDVVITNMMQRGFTSIVARRDVLLGGMRGRHIGYGFGSNAHYSLLQALSAVGLNEEDVHLIPMDIGEMPEALHSGKVDAFSAWEPTPTITLKKYKDTIIIYSKLNSGYLYFPKDFAIEHHDAMYHIVAAAMRAISWMQASDENLGRASLWSRKSGEKLIGKSLEISDEEVARLAKEDIIGMKQPCRIPKGDLELIGSLYYEFEFLKALDKIPATADWSEVQNSFDKRIVEEILANPKKYRLYEYDYIEKEGSDE